MSISNDIKFIGRCASRPKMMETRRGTKKALVNVYESYTPQYISETKVWHECVFFGDNATRADELLMKGTQIYVDGMLNYEINQTNKGYQRKAVIWVNEFMNTSRATMTTELYRDIFEKELLPYQVIISEGNGYLTITAIIKLFDLAREINCLQHHDVRMRFAIKGYYDLYVGEDRRYVNNIQESKQTLGLTSSQIPLIDSELLSEEQVHLCVEYDRKTYFETTIEYKKLIDNHTQRKTT